MTDGQEVRKLTHQDINRAVEYARFTLHGVVWRYLKFDPRQLEYPSPEGDLRHTTTLQREGWDLVTSVLLLMSWLTGVKVKETGEVGITELREQLSQSGVVLTSYEDRSQHLSTEALSNYLTDRFNLIRAVFIEALSRLADHDLQTNGRYLKALTQARVETMDIGQFAQFMAEFTANEENPSPRLLERGPIPPPQPAEPVARQARREEPRPVPPQGQPQDRQDGGGNPIIDAIKTVVPGLTNRSDDDLREQVGQIRTDVDHVMRKQEDQFLDLVQRIDTLGEAINRKVDGTSLDHRLAQLRFVPAEEVDERFAQMREQMASLRGDVVVLMSEMEAKRLRKLEQDTAMWAMLLGIRIPDELNEFGPENEHPADRRWNYVSSQTQAGFVWDIDLIRNDIRSLGGEIAELRREMRGYQPPPPPTRQPLEEPQIPTWMRPVQPTTAGEPLVPPIVTRQQAWPSDEELEPVTREQLAQPATAPPIDPARAKILRDLFGDDPELIVQDESDPNAYHYSGPKRWMQVVPVHTELSVKGGRTFKEGSRTSFTNATLRFV